MNYEQLKQPNLNIVGKEGYCLVYVREVFGVAAEYPSASVAWENAQFKHAGEQPPAAAVPIWFSWQTDGHVAVWDNGTIYSTTAQGDKTFGSIQELVDFIGEGIVYLGWSEDINSVRVVQPQEEDMSQITDLQTQIAGLQAELTGERAGYASLLAKANGLQTELDAERVGNAATITNLQTQIAELQTKLSTATDQQIPVPTTPAPSSTSFWTTIKRILKG